MNDKKSKSSANSIFSRTNQSKDDTQFRVSSSHFSSRPRDSIPSLSCFLNLESDRTNSGSSLTPCLSTPLLSIHNNTSFSDTERDIQTVDSDFPTTYDGGDDDEINIYEEELCFDTSDLFSLSSSLMPNSSSNVENPENETDYHSVLTVDASTSAIDKVPRGDEGTYSYSSKKMRGRSKRMLSSWYQVKRESFAKSYRDKVKHFRKIFENTPVDTDRFLVDYSCALVKNKNGILLLGRMYITDEWICFYSKIIYELKLHIAVDDIETVSRAKTARFIPNAIQITLKSNKERYFFTSFSSRKRTFAFLKKVCENSRSGGVANMEELLCQVQDVYGDDSLTFLDFVDGDDEDFYPSNQGDNVTSTSELNVTSTINSLQLSPNSSERVRVPTSSRRPKSRSNFHGSKHYIPSASTDDEALILRSRSPRSAPSPHFTPTTTVRSLSSSGDLTEGSDIVTNSIASTDDEAKGGIELSFDKRQRDNLDNDSYSQRKASRPSMSHRKFESAGPAENGRPSRSSSSRTKSDTEDAFFDPDLGEETPLRPVSCGSGHKHPGRTYAAIDINVSVDALFTFLFTDSHFFASFCEHRGIFDMQQDRWPSKPWRVSTSNDETVHRKISYVLTLKQRLGPRTCRAFESQTILLSETRPGMRYVVDATVTNEAVPLCNSFHVTTRYCLLRRSATVSHLIITSDVIYDRPVFFGAKSIIESTCRSNLTDNFTDLVDHLAKAALRLSDHERITGGSFAQAHHTQLNRASNDVSRKDKDGGGSVESGSEGDQVSKGSISNSIPPTGVIGHHQSPRGLSIPQVLLCANQQSDGRWLFIITVSLGLCVLLSVVYNRYQNVEKITADHLEFTARAAVRPGSTPTPTPNLNPNPRCDDMDSIRLLLDSVSGVLSQMRTTLDLLERRLDHLASKSCRSTSKDAFLGH